jgi:formylglycine-generating enzyme required for sulfatase activity
MNTVKLTGLLLSALAAAGGLFWLGLEHTNSTGFPAGLSTAGTCSIPAGDPAHPGMVWVPPGAFTMGAEYAYREEGPAHAEELSGFWMDQSEVTNAQFAEFVDATGYLTLAERGISAPDQPDLSTPGSAVFKPPPAEGEPDPFASWWQFVEGANWRNPQGPGSSIAGLDQHPVVHIAYEDALAYADWKGHSLPSEEQFEYAAQTSAHRDEAGFKSNTWQGFFPFQNDPLDGYTGTAPAGCYTANALGLYDLIGNVWEWTASPYYLGHDFSAKASYPEGYDPAQPDEPVAVIKGGSYLCAPNYCMRYRPEARQGQSKGLGTSHIGFRTVLNP